jgi:hypothetical protein
MADKVKHPDHYNKGKIEVIDFILDQTLDFYRGNIVKYISRHRWKNGKEDVEKALFYTEYLLENINDIPRITLNPEIYSEDFCVDQQLGFEESEIIDNVVEQSPEHLPDTIILIHKLIKEYDKNRTSSDD